MMRRKRRLFFLRETTGTETIYIFNKTGSLLDKFSGEGYSQMQCLREELATFQITPIIMVQTQELILQIFFKWKKYLDWRRKTQCRKGISNIITQCHNSICGWLNKECIINFCRDYINYNKTCSLSSGNYNWQ